MDGQIRDLFVWFSFLFLFEIGIVGFKNICSKFFCRRVIKETMYFHPFSRHITTTLLNIVIDKNAVQKKKTNKSYQFIKVKYLQHTLSSTDVLLNNQKCEMSKSTKLYKFCIFNLKCIISMVLYTHMCV